jgi:hypothetical protein
MLQCHVDTVPTYGRKYSTVAHVLKGISSPYKTCYRVENVLAFAAAETDPSCSPSKCPQRTHTNPQKSNARLKSIIPT